MSQNQCPRVYVNPGGNVVASGLYRSYLTQDVANDFPGWMHLRHNQNSVGQQFLGAFATNLEKIQKDLQYGMRTEFLTTAPLDEIDVLYRLQVPGNININKNIICVASVSGVAVAPSGAYQPSEIDSLEDFYYNVIPTRLEVTGSLSFAPTIDSKNWNFTTSGVRDLEQKYYDVWRKSHIITWTYLDGNFMKQDIESLGVYEQYPQSPSVSGVVTGMDFYKGFLWCASTTGANNYLSIISTKTQMPPAVYLDTIAVFDITNTMAPAPTGYLAPSGVLIDAAGVINLCSADKNIVYTVNPRYDYFAVDANNGTIYFREDYTESGVTVFNSNSPFNPYGIVQLYDDIGDVLVDDGANLLYTQVY
jgi:hypothetical protein